MTGDVRLQRLDGVLSFLWITAAALGVFAVLDAVYPSAIASGGMATQVRQQLLNLGLAIGAYWACLRLPQHALRPIGVLVFVTGLMGCALIWIYPALGAEINGARRWLILPGGFTVQPSELLKPGVVFVLALLFEGGSRQRAAHRNGWKRASRLAVFASIALAALSIERQPDLGTAVVVMVIVFCMLWLGGTRWTTMLALVACSVLAAVVFVSLEPYRLERILSHADRWNPEVSRATGYQPVRAEVGIGMGGFAGQGIGMGLAKYVLPAVTTDFVFVTIAEEGGFLGSLIVLGVIAAIVGRLFVLGARAPTKFAAIAAAGIACWIGFQASLNLFMVTGILPPIGIPLPFFSAGGSSLLGLALGLGIVQSAMTAERREDACDATRDLRRRNGRTRVPGSPYRVRCGFSRT